MWIIDSDQAVNISDFDWIGLDHTTNCTIGARLGGKTEFIAPSGCYDKIIQAIKNNDNYVEVI